MVNPAALVLAVLMLAAFVWCPWFEYQEFKRKEGKR